MLDVCTGREGVLAYLLDVALLEKAGLFIGSGASNLRSVSLFPPRTHPPSRTQSQTPSRYRIAVVVACASLIRSPASGACALLLFLL